MLSCVRLLQMLFTLIFAAQNMQKGLFSRQAHTSLNSYEILLRGKKAASNDKQIRSFLRIWSHMLKKSLMENFIFCPVCAAL